MSAAHLAMLKSVEQGSPFTVDNIPFGVISTPGSPKPRCATAFGDYAIDLSALERDGFLSDVPGLKGKSGFEITGNVFSQVCVSSMSCRTCDEFLIWSEQPTLNAFAAMPKEIRLKVRNSLIRYFHDGLPPSYYIPLGTVTYHYPMDTSNFSDFFCSLEHVKNVRPSPAFIPQTYTLTKPLIVRQSNERPHNSKLLLNPPSLQRPHLQSENHKHPHPPPPRRNPTISQQPPNLRPNPSPRLRARNGSLHLETLAFRRDPGHS